MPEELTDDEVVRRFHLLWYEARQEDTWKRSHWFGAGIQQCPFDLWVFQEIVAETKPEAFVELGVKRGGMTLYAANLFDLLHGGDLKKGIVVGVDVHLGAVAGPTRSHPRVSLIEGSSTDPDVLEQVRELCKGRRVMVMADSDHSAAHVKAELELYGPLVAPGGYLIVSDSNINGHPAAEGWGPGPYEAIEEFLEESDDFVVDSDRERHMLTLNPKGFLRRRRRMERLLGRDR